MGLVAREGRVCSRCIYLAPTVWPGCIRTVEGRKEGEKGRGRYVPALWTLEVNGSACGRCHRGLGSGRNKPRVLKNQGKG